MEVSSVTEQGGVQPAAPVSLMEKYLNDPSHDYRTLKYRGCHGRDHHARRPGRAPGRHRIQVRRDCAGERVLLSDLRARSRRLRSVKRCWSSSSSPRTRRATRSLASTARARRRAGGSCRRSTKRTSVIDAEVTNYNKGGLLVNLDGVRGFVPASQVTEIRGGDDASKQADMARLIGTLSRSRSSRSTAIATG